MRPAALMSFLNQTTSAEDFAREIADIEAGNYIADALIMSDEFDLADDDALIEGIHALAQDNPLPTRQAVQELLDRVA